LPFLGFLKSIRIKEPDLLFRELINKLCPIMCGLFGFLDRQQNLTPGKADALAQGLAIGAMDRGEDASGYAVLSEKGIGVHKKAVPASELYIQTRGSPMMIGHTRYATMGNPNSDSQAHPFLSCDKSFALTHNGVGTADFKRLQKTRPSLGTEIDSQAMTRYIEAVGHSPSGLADFLKAWKTSSIAIAILDKASESLILFRNDRNPLILAETTCGILIYASTTDIIETGCLAAELEVKRFASVPPFERHQLFLNGQIKINRLDMPVRKIAGF
jgi:glucosamine 6-phosphate synthetase-like amidotransferase/phosphosugar isomerase protein